MFAMEYFELYLDESGQFKERGKYGHPSIVAGYLMHKKCSEAWAENIFAKVQDKNSSFSKIDIKHFHAMEADQALIPEFNVCLLEALQNGGAEMVVFKNARGNDIVNSDITYLNVFAEGIFRLMYDLLVRFTGDIRLSITYAKRLQVEEKEKSGIIQTIADDAYTERIQERILLRMAHIAPNDRRRITYTMHKDSAQRSPLLMLADAVNYSFRGGVSSLSPAQKARIGALNQRIFDVLAHSGWEQIQASITSNRWAEAVYSWYGEYYDELQERHHGEFHRLIIDRLRLLGTASSKVQLEILSNLSKALIDTRNYRTANKFMERLDQKLFPLLSEAGLLSPDADFDLHFLRLTTATHQGDLAEAENQIRICREKLPHLPATWETMDYYLSYKLREAEHQKNTFDFQGAVANLDQLERILTDAVSVVQMIDELGEFGERIKSTTLGKVLGSRVTARCYLAYESPAQLALARDDSDAAMEQFHRPQDKARQYMTRSMVEYMDGRFEDALRWLGKAYGAEDADPAKLLAELRKDKNAAVFGIYYFTGLMAAALRHDHPLGREMFDAWNLIPPADMIPDSNEYPTNIILWRMAACKAMMRQGTAHQYYEKAISVTDSNPKNLPHYMARLAMKAEREGLLGAENKIRSAGKRVSLETDYQNLRAYYPIGNIKLVDDIGGMIADLKDAADADEKRRLYLKIAHRVPIL